MTEAIWSTCRKGWQTGARKIPQSLLLRLTCHCPQSGVHYSGERISIWLIECNPVISLCYQEAQLQSNLHTGEKKTHNALGCKKVAADVTRELSITREGVCRDIYTHVYTHRIFLIKWRIICWLFFVSYIHFWRCVVFWTSFQKSEKATVLRMFPVVGSKLAAILE